MDAEAAYVDRRFQALNDQAPVKSPSIIVCVAAAPHAHVPTHPQDKPVLNSVRLDTYYRIAETLFLQFKSYLEMGDMQTACVGPARLCARLWGDSLIPCVLCAPAIRRYVYGKRFSGYVYSVYIVCVLLRRAARVRACRLGLKGIRGHTAFPQPQYAPNKAWLTRVRTLHCVFEYLYVDVPAVVPVIDTCGQCSAICNAYVAVLRGLDCLCLNVFVVPLLLFVQIAVICDHSPELVVMDVCLCAMAAPLTHCHTEPGRVVGEHGAHERGADGAI